MVLKLDIFSNRLEHIRNPNYKHLYSAVEATTEPVLVYDSKKVKPVVDLPIHSHIKPFSTDPTVSKTESTAKTMTGKSIPLGVVPDSAAYRRVLASQKLFLTQDGLYVWQKRPSDRPLLYLTAGLLSIGVGYTLYTFYTKIFPKKN